VGEWEFTVTKCLAALAAGGTPASRRLSDRAAGVWLIDRRLRRRDAAGFRQDARVTSAEFVMHASLNGCAQNFGV